MSKKWSTEDKGFLVSIMGLVALFVINKNWLSIYFAPCSNTFISIIMAFGELFIINLSYAFFLSIRYAWLLSIDTSTISCKEYINKLIKIFNINNEKNEDAIMSGEAFENAIMSGEAFASGGAITKEFRDKIMEYSHPELLGAINDLDIITAKKVCCLFQLPISIWEEPYTEEE